MEGDNFKIEKLQKEADYHQWKFQVKIVVRSKKLWGHVDETVKKPVRENYNKSEDFVRDLEKFEDNEFKAQRVVVTSLGKEAMLHVMNSDLVADMWKRLETVYEKKSKVTVHLIRERFYNFKMESGETMAIQIAKLQTIVQQLKDLGEKVEDDQIITKLLVSLPQEYLHFNSAWDSTTKAQQTLDHLTTRLIMEEGRIERQHQGQTGDALMTRKFQKKNFNKPRYTLKQATENAKKCYACNEIGHIAVNCPNKSRTLHGKTNGATTKKPYNGNNGSHFKRNNGSNNGNTNQRSEAFLTIAEAFTATEQDENWYIGTFGGE